MIEDSRNGMLAAVRAGMHCVVTTSVYTKNEEFDEADAVFPELGDSPNIHVTLRQLQQLTAR